MSRDDSSEASLRDAFRVHVVVGFILLGISLAIALLLLSGLPKAFVVVGTMIPLGVAIYPFWIALGLRRDLRQGLILERCYIQRTTTFKREMLLTKTKRGLLGLANWTGIAGKDLERKWVDLTYGQYSSIALEAKVVDEVT